MPSERVRWGALLAALTLSGCAYEWDSLRPGPDAGTGLDVGPPRDVGADTGMATDRGADARVDGGVTDAGATDTGPVDAPMAMDVIDVPEVVDVPVTIDVPVVIDNGPPDTGPMDTGPLDTGPRDTGPLDTGPRDTGPLDTGPVDTGPRDTGPVDTGPRDTGPTDTGPPPCTGPLCPCAPTAPAGWCAVGSTCTSGTCVVGTLTGALVITEVMNDLATPLSEPEGEWIEVYNPGASAVNLMNVRVRDAATVSRALVFPAGSSILGPRSYAVLARDPTLDITGGPMAFATYDTVALNNSGSETVTIETTDSAVIDSITYGTSWPNMEAHSKSLRPPILDAVMNNSAANWCDSSTSYTTNHFGTPGAANVCP